MPRPSCCWLSTIANTSGTRQVRWCYEALAWKHQVDQVSVLHKLGLQEPARRSLQKLASHSLINGQVELGERIESAADSMLGSDVASALQSARLVEFEDRPTAHRASDAQGPPETEQLSELTKRERELLFEVGSGKTNTEIAEAPFISRRTVDAHLSHIRTKLGVTARSKLIVLAREHL